MRRSGPYYSNPSYSPHVRVDMDEEEDLRRLSSIYHGFDNDDTIRREPPRDDTIRREPPRDDTIRREPQRDDTIRREPPRDDTIRREPPRDDTIRREPPRDDTIRREPPRDDTIRREPPRDDTIRREPPRDDTIRREPLRDYDINTKQTPENTLYFVPVEDRPDGASTSRQSWSADSMAHSLVQVPGPDNRNSGGKMYFESSDVNPDGGPREVYVYDQPKDDPNDPENTLYLMPTVEPGSPIRNQPRATDYQAKPLELISGKDGQYSDGKMYFEAVGADADGGPRIVYVLEPPHGEPPVEEPPREDYPREPPPQQMTREPEQHHFWQGRQGPVEIPFSAEDIRKASPNWFKLFKSIFTAAFIVLELVGEYITLGNMYSHHESNSDTSNTIDTISDYFSKTSFQCDSENATVNLTHAYTVFVVLQNLFAIMRIINIVGETIDDVKGDGFQIMHGWDESALGLMMIDFPETVILIGFITQCNKKPTTKWLLITPILSLIKNITRKNTTRQKPNKLIKIPLICYSFVLFDEEGNASFSLKPEPWKIYYPAFFWDWVLYSDVGLCSDEKHCCACTPRPWKCISCTFCCCIKLNLCSGVGCGDIQPCTVECGNQVGIIVKLIILIVRLSFLIIIWFFKTLFVVLRHIFEKFSSDKRLQPVDSDNMDVQLAFRLLAGIQFGLPLFGMFLSFVMGIGSDITASSDFYSSQYSHTYNNNYNSYNNINYDNNYNHNYNTYNHNKNCYWTSENKPYADWPGDSNKNYRYTDEYGYHEKYSTIPSSGDLYSHWYNATYCDLYKWYKYVDYLRRL